MKKTKRRAAAGTKAAARIVRRRTVAEPGTRRRVPVATSAPEAIADKTTGRTTVLRRVAVVRRNVTLARAMSDPEVTAPIVVNAPVRGKLKRHARPRKSAKRKAA